MVHSPMSVPSVLNGPRNAVRPVRRLKRGGMFDLVSDPDLVDPALDDVPETVVPDAHVQPSAGTTFQRSGILDPDHAFAVQEHVVDALPGPRGAVPVDFQVLPLADLQSGRLDVPLVLRRVEAESQGGVEQIHLERRLPLLFARLLRRTVPSNQRVVHPLLVRLHQEPEVHGASPGIEIACRVVGTVGGATGEIQSSPPSPPRNCPGHLVHVWPYRTRRRGPKSKIRLRRRTICVNKKQDFSPGRRVEPHDQKRHQEDHTAHVCPKIRDGG